MLSFHAERDVSLLSLIQVQTLLTRQPAESIISCLLDTIADRYQLERQRDVDRLDINLGGQRTSRKATLGSQFWTILHRPILYIQDWMN